MSRDRLLFVLKFAAILIALYLLVAWNPVNDRVIVPFTRAVTIAAAALLNIAGQNASVNGTMIETNGFLVDVRNGCNGVEAMIFLVAAIGAFPAPWPFRLTGMVGGSITLQLLNVIRVATLAWLGGAHPSLFQTFHVAVWQTLIILVSVFLFLIWSTRIAPRRLANGA